MTKYLSKNCHLIIMGATIFFILQLLQFAFGLNNEIFKKTTAHAGDIYVAQWLFLIYYLGATPSLFAFIPLYWIVDRRIRGFSAAALILLNASAEVIRNNMGAYQIADTGLTAKSMAINFAVVLSIGVGAYFILAVVLQLFTTLRKRIK